VFQGIEIAPGDTRIAFSVFEGEAAGFARPL
jgi:hypothetical protein